MKVTYADLLNAQKGFDDLLEQSLPVRVSVKLFALAKAVQAPLGEFESARQKLLKDNGNEVSPAVTTQFIELIGTEFDLPIEKVVVPAEFNGHEIAVKPATLAVLDKFIEIK